MSQPSCTFNTCCGCIELRTGCLIIGFLNLMAVIQHIVMRVVFLLLVGQRLDHNPYAEFFVTFSIVYLLIFLMFLALTVLLLVGVHKNKRGHVMWYQMVFPVLLLLYTFVLGASFFYPGAFIEFSDIISKVIFLPLNIYFVLVVRSYYHKMDDSKRQDGGQVYSPVTATATS